MSIRDFAKTILSEIHRLATPLLLIVFGLFVWGINELVTTISLILFFAGVVLILGHIISKEIFRKYNWDVGRRLNYVWLVVTKKDDLPTDKSKVLAILAVGMLLARVIIYAVVVLSLTLLINFLLKGSAFGFPPPIADPPSSLLNILKEEHQKIWHEADIYILMGQIKAESNWKETAMRKEPSGVTSYGLFQVLDITLKDLQKKHKILKDIEPYQMLRARYGIRAGILYDLQMWNLTKFASDYISHWAFTLSAYNGGYGWLLRDRELTAKNGFDNNVWFGNVERFSKRSNWAFKINREYPVKIFKFANSYRGRAGNV